MGMVAVVAVLGSSIHGHCAIGEEVLEIYLLTSRAGALYLNVRIPAEGKGKKSKNKIKRGVPLHYSGIRWNPFFFFFA